MMTGKLNPVRLFFQTTEITSSIVSTIGKLDCHRPSDWVKDFCFRKELYFNHHFK